VIVVAGHELVKTRLCKEPGCDQEVAKPGTRGVWAAYCDMHARDCVRRGGGAKGGTAEVAVRELLAAARRLDQAKVKATAAVEAYERAKGDYQRALADVNSAGGQVG
jgi:hypothetical protein